MRLWVLRSMVVGLVFCLNAGTAHGQDCLTEARLTAFGGPAFFTGATGARPFEMGMSADARLIHAGSPTVGLGVLVEGGVFHPAITGTGNYYLSGDAMLARVQPGWVSDAMRVRPFVVAGYTRF